MKLYSVIECTAPSPHFAKLLRPQINVAFIIFHMCQNNSYCVDISTSDGLM